jgi:hypothetical protein
MSWKLPKCGLCGSITHGSDNCTSYTVHFVVQRGNDVLLFNADGKLRLVEGPLLNGWNAPRTAIHYCELLKLDVDGDMFDCSFERSDGMTIIQYTSEEADSVVRNIDGDSYVWMSLDKATTEQAHQLSEGTLKCLTKLSTRDSI